MQQCSHQLHPHGPRDDRRQAGHQGGFATLLANAYAGDRSVIIDHAHSLRTYLLSNNKHKPACGCQFCCRCLAFILHGGMWGVSNARTACKQKTQSVGMCASLSTQDCTHQASAAETGRFITRMLLSACI